MEKETRQTKYDMIRATAMIFVVLMHLCAHVSAEPFGAKWWLKSAVMLFVSTCNGLFFLLSGKFNLVSKNSDDPIRFYRRRAVSVILPFIVCSLICYLAEKSLIGADENYITSLISVFPTTHYWFVYELIGLIFWTPFFAVIMENIDLNRKLIMTAVVLVFQFSFVLLKDCGTYPGYEFPLMGWPLFYLVGSFADEIPDKWKKRLTVIGIACFFISLLQMRLLPDASQGLQDLSPKYFFTVLAVYYGLQRLTLPTILEKAALWLAKYSYYVYLFHNTLIMLFFSEKLGIYDAIISRTGTAVFLLIVFVLSIGISVILGAIIKKILSFINVK